jgi:hypothetical protein
MAIEFIKDARFIHEKFGINQLIKCGECFPILAKNDMYILKLNGREMMYSKNAMDNWVDSGYIKLWM